MRTSFFRLLVAMLISVCSISASAQALFYPPFDISGFLQPPEQLVSGRPMTLSLTSAGYCEDFRRVITSRFELVREPNRLIVRQTGHCFQPSPVIFRKFRFNVDSLPAGNYDIVYEVYAFDGTFLGGDQMPFNGTLPFTVLPATAENLERVQRVPTLSHFGLGLLWALIAGAAYFVRGLRERR
jgi:hypothetical protein